MLRIENQQARWKANGPGTDPGIRLSHSDCGSEYINHTVAKLLNKLLIKQTKSRPRHSNDNGLAEAKNGALIRKHMGH